MNARKSTWKLAAVITEGTSACTTLDPSPSPLKGERAGVRGEAVRLTCRLLCGLVSMLMVFFASMIPGALGEGKAESAPPFDLPRRGTQERVRLQDFAGQVLVLDFFAYWCLPCAAASQELETGVQQFYAAHKGNPQGAPVRVVSVNIEQEFPKRTEEFLRRTGASFVVDDFSGSLLKQFGGGAIPLLVIVDGTGSRPGAPRFEVVYKHEGFEGTKRVRGIIDGLGATNGVPSARISPAIGSADRSVAGAPWVNTLQVNPEFTWASDMFLSDSKIQFGQDLGSVEWTAAFSYATYDMDYRPNNQFDFFGFKEHLHEERYSGELNLRQRVGERFTLLGAGGVYSGYPNYRRVWIANRYRQKYATAGFPVIPGYTEPDPKGWNIAPGLRWEYLPAIGYAEVKFSYAHDRTAPGYEDSSDSLGNYLLLRGREQLDTESVSFSSENVLAKRLRALNEFSFIQTTARELRFTYQGSLNLALGERWVVRGSGGVATEAPRFDAFFFGATGEYELMPSLLLSVTGRYYKDTGEIENGLLTSSAAPPLESWEAGVGLRYSWGRSSLKIYVAPFWTNYAPIEVGTAEFAHLYADRKWVLAQIAWSLQF